MKTQENSEIKNRLALGGSPVLGNNNDNGKKEPKLKVEQALNHPPIPFEMCGDIRLSGGHLK